MPTIQEVRQKYPDYQDLSDVQLADALHTKFYSDMDKPSFYKSIGLGGEEQQPTVSQPDMSAIERFGVGTGYGMEQGGLGVMQRVYEGGAAIRDMFGMEQPNAQRIADIQARVQGNRESVAPLTAESQATPWYQPTAFGTGQAIGNTAVTAPLTPGGTATSAMGILGNAAFQGAIQGAVQPTVGDESAFQNAGMGALVGGTTGLGMAGVGKGVNSLWGKLPQNFRETLSKKYGIRTTLGETTGNPNIQRTETWLERLPSVIGLRDFREKQLQEADSAAKTALSIYMRDPGATDVMGVNRSYASNLFETLKSKVGGIGKQEIQPNATRTTALEMEDSLSDLFKTFQNLGLERRLKNISKDTIEVKQDPLDVLSGLYNMPKGSTSKIKTMSFQDMWELRDNLGELIGQAKKKLEGGDINRKQYSEWSRLYAAVNEDIDTWAAQIGRPDVKEAITAANGAFKHYVVKYDKLQDAYDASVRLKDGEKSFIPERFSSELQKLIKGDKEYKSFSPTELEELDGLSKIMQIVNRSGKYKENLPTGDRWGIFGAATAAAGTAYASPMAGLAGGASIGLARILTGTEWGKKIALAASKMDASNPNLNILIEMAYSQIPKLAATKATSK
jgi:hypothetical protein